MVLLVLQLLFLQAVLHLIAYNWSNGVTTQTDNNLLAGTYTCMVTSKGGCPDTTVFNITNPTSPSVTVSPTLDSICSGGNLKLTASVLQDIRGSLQQA